MGECHLLAQLHLFIEDSELVIEAAGRLANPHQAAVEPALVRVLFRAAARVEPEGPEVEARLSAKPHVRVILCGFGPDLAAVDLEPLDKQLGLPRMVKRTAASGVVSNSGCERGLCASTPPRS